jgi:hypothetical protein
MAAQLLLTSAGARPLDAIEVEGLVSVAFDGSVKSQVIRVGGRATAKATSLAVRCSSRLRFVVLQMAPVGADGASFELHMRVRDCPRPSTLLSSSLGNIAEPVWLTVRSTRL